MSKVESCALNGAFIATVADYEMPCTVMSSVSWDIDVLLSEKAGYIVPTSVRTSNSTRLFYIYVAFCHCALEAHRPHLHIGPSNRLHGFTRIVEPNFISVTEIPG